MAQFRIDLKDIIFNLFDVLQIQKNNLGLDTKDMENIVQEFSGFASREVFTSRSEGDTQGAKWTNKGVEVPQIFKSSNRKFYESGWFGLGFDEAWGGTAVPKSLSVACCSIITGANPAWCLYPMLSKAAAGVINLIGTEEQKNIFVPAMLEGRFGGTMCLTEAGAGSDVGNLRSTAKPLGDGRYAIQGTKIFITSGDNDIYENIVHLVLARTPAGEAGTKGLSLFIVPKLQVDAKGKVTKTNDVKCTKIEEKMGLHGSATCELVFGQDNQCEGWLLGNELDGIKNMFIMMNEARLDCGLQGEAQTNLAYELTLQYIQEREQFGKPIIQHPDVTKTILKMRAMGRGLRALCLYVGNLFDTHEDEEIGLLTPICKAYCTDQAMLQSIDAVQLHGGYGYCQEYGIEQFMRDIKISAIYEGTNGIQAIDFMQRKILKDHAKTLKIVQSKIDATLSNAAGHATLAHECTVLRDAVQLFQNATTRLFALAQNKETEKLLLQCTEYLKMAGHIFTSWQLLIHAVKAQELLPKASSTSEQQFLKSKLLDFKIFSTYFLTEVFAIDKTLLQPTISSGVIIYNAEHFHT